MIRQKKIYQAAIFTIIISTLLTACGNNGKNNQTAPTPTESVTAVPNKTLVICVGDEPSSLYLYGNSSQSMWSILESVYDGPIDIVNFEPDPVILTALPSVENGTVKIQAAAVTTGDLVANTEGDVVSLEKGVRVFPDGCTSSDCAMEWDGTSELQLSQMVVKFNLRPDLKWSDGQPLTADDSVYSFLVSADAATLASKTQIKRTQAYVSLDSRTVEWTGIPGYLTLNPSSFFWIPLPKHQLGQFTAKQLNTASETTRTPLGWGPYMITNWVSGSQIKMVKNPNYFRASEGLPYYDEVIYRFIGNIPVTDISPVVNGECDIIDTSVSMSDQWKTIRSLELSGKIKGYFAQGPEWEGLNFGIKPNSYDEVFNPYLDRANYFGDVRTRQAIASCIDREKIVESQIYSLGDVPDSYLTADHPFHVAGLATYPYDPEKGRALLDEVGWKDTDGDGSTPRIAVGVDTVMNDTPFEITYVATDSQLHGDIASAIQSYLQQCGIKVNISLQPVDKIYAAGPDGVVFGRNFDLAEFGWTTGNRPPCYLYASTEIPTAGNSWMGTKYGGVNFTGYENSAYNLACQKQLSSGLDREGMIQSNTEAMTILANDLPMIPLFYQVKAMVSRPDLCGLTLDASSRSGLREIELIRTGAGCPAK